MLRPWLKHDTRIICPSIAASAVPSSSRARMLRIGLSVSKIRCSTGVR